MKNLGFVRRQIARADYLFGLTQLDRIESDRSNALVRLEAEFRRGLADRISDEIWREVSIVPFDHARIAMTEILGDYHQRHSAHDRVRCPCVA